MIERRKQARMEAAYEVFVSHQSKTSISKSRDISPRGIGLYAVDPIPAGAPVDITVTPSEGMVNVSLKGATRYCVENQFRNDGRRFLVGVEFDQESARDLPFFEIQGDVMKFKASHSVPINAGVTDCYRMICDFPRYPEWTKVMESVKIIDRYPDGRAKRVEFNANAYFRKVKTVLDYSYDDQNNSLSWESAGGDFLTVTGRYFFSPLGTGRASSTYQLNIDLNFYIPDRIANYFSGIVMRKSMKDFQKFVEKNVKR